MSDLTVHLIKLPNDACKWIGTVATPERCPNLDKYVGRCPRCGVPLPTFTLPSQGTAA